MNVVYARKLRLGYGIFLGLFTVVIGILFIVEAAQIYYSGVATPGDPYSREIVGERLSLIMIPIILWLLAAGVGYILSVLLPVTQKERASASPETALKRLKKRIPQGQSQEFLAEAKQYRKFETMKIVAWSVAAGFALLSAVMGIVYLANTAHFTATNLTGEILSMVKNVMPWVGVSLLLFIGASLLEYFTAKQELDSVKKLIVLGKGNPVREPSAFVSKRDAVLAFAGDKRTTLVLRLVVLALAVTFIVLGIVNGGMTDVFIKAINICTECIGLG